MWCAANGQAWPQTGSRKPQALIFMFLRTHLFLSDLINIYSFPGVPDVDCNQRDNKGNEHHGFQCKET